MSKLCDVEMSLKEGYLSLEDGSAIKGVLFSEKNQSVSGEVVFTTGMTGYPESLTDPSFAGQILVFTYPLMGNYGVALSDLESKKIQVSAVVISETTHNWSHRAAVLSLVGWLQKEKIPLLMGVDTRELVKRIRTQGSLAGMISENPIRALDIAPAVFDLVGLVSPKDVTTFRGAHFDPHSQKAKRIIAVDCGMKKSLLDELLRFPLEVVRVPYDYDYLEAESNVSGIFISNGPGDPVFCKKTIEILARAMKKKIPIFGVCLGCQLLALASGGRTLKLKFGHRGQNVPVLHTQSKRCYITSQNHGYAVDENALSSDWEVSFRNLNDGTVEGISHRKEPFFAVQFHPEAAPGPTETRFLFERFLQCL